MAVVIATAFGCVALFCVIIWPFFSDYRTVVKIQSVGAAAFAVYFLMLGSPTAAVACLISCAQLLVSASVRDRYVVVRLYGASLIVLSFLSVITWHGIPSALALTGSSLGSLARLQTSTTRMKGLFLVGAPFWLAHNLIVGAMFALGTDAVSLSSNLANLLRLMVRRWRTFPFSPTPSGAVETPAGIFAQGRAV
ncbi:YgjV family protein [Sphingobium sp. Z007]|uniref:YgjV family protein n=1 Tax=Sphingobium sp. Z007 TaxID=627495 RepID=UPI0020CC3CF3|nr:YgjV family protein [Sphingobium sp. Z007]